MNEALGYVSGAKRSWMAYAPRLENAAGGKRIGKSFMSCLLNSSIFLPGGPANMETITQ